MTSSGTIENGQCDESRECNDATGLVSVESQYEARELEVDTSGRRRMASHVAQSLSLPGTYVPAQTVLCRSLRVGRDRTGDHGGDSDLGMLAINRGAIPTPTLAGYPLARGLIRGPLRPVPEGASTLLWRRRWRIAASCTLSPGEETWAVLPTAD